jgi:hypothetical protein
MVVRLGQLLQVNSCNPGITGMVVMLGQLLQVNSCNPGISGIIVTEGQQTICVTPLYSLLQILHISVVISKHIPIFQFQAVST